MFNADDTETAKEGAKVDARFNKQNDQWVM